MKRDLRRDIAWGIHWGKQFSSYYTLLALAWLVFAGRFAWGRWGFRIFLIVPFYWGAGVVAGAIIGLLRPLGRTLLGQVLIATIAGFPVCFGGAMIVIPFEKWAELLVPTGLIATLALAPLAGVVNWIVSRD